ncbi:TetR/AcrR family transcriptional regulator [Halobacillus rhizosphaerae]|uniref:TetR/AcrR family transcriptional regulator n=1 Tax=Halobacillus rhizosphaerae TaxID=3064889 RepID=UPI00398B16C7
MSKNRNLSPGRTERRDAAQNRQRILDAAHNLFTQKGVEAVSMNQIAAEAEIGAGTLYRRYRNKGELCLALIKDNVVLCFESIDSYLEDNHTEPPHERLKGILSLFIQFRESKSQLLKGVEDGESAQRPATARSPLFTELHEKIVCLFEEMDEHHSNSTFKADILLAALKSEEYLFQRDVRGYSPDEILDHICSLFIPQT